MDQLPLGDLRNICRVSSGFHSHCRDEYFQHRLFTLRKLRVQSNSRLWVSRLEFGIPDFSTQTQRFFQYFEEALKTREDDLVQNFLSSIQVVNLLSWNHLARLMVSHGANKFLRQFYRDFSSWLQRVGADPAKYQICHFGRSFEWALKSGHRETARLLFELSIKTIEANPVKGFETLSDVLTLTIGKEERELTDLLFPHLLTSLKILSGDARERGLGLLSKLAADLARVRWVDLLDVLLTFDEPSREFHQFLANALGGIEDIRRTAAEGEDLTLFDCLIKTPYLNVQKDLGKMVLRASSQGWTQPLRRIYREFGHQLPEEIFQEMIKGAVIGKDQWLYQELKDQVPKENTLLEKAAEVNNLEALSDLLSGLDRSRTSKGKPTDYGWGMTMEDLREKLGDAFLRTLGQNHQESFHLLLSYQGWHPRFTCWFSLLSSLMEGLENQAHQLIRDFIRLFKPIIGPDLHHTLLLAAISVNDRGIIREMVEKGERVNFWKSTEVSPERDGFLSYLEEIERREPGSLERILEEIETDEIRDLPRVRKLILKVLARE